MPHCPYEHEDSPTVARPRDAIGVAPPTGQGTESVPYHVLAPWAALVVLGMVSMFLYEFKGEIPRAAASSWPATLTSSVSPDRPTIVFFVHPKCPCTAASIAELDRVLSDYPDAFAVQVVATLPPEADTSWTQSANLVAARRLPGASVVLDRDGGITLAFRARASGTVLVFDTDGALLFRGGVTASRGHEGASTGTIALRALAAGEAVARQDTPVFGCDLISHGRESRAP